MLRNVVSTHGLRLCKSLGLRRARSIVLGGLLVSAAALAGCRSADSYRCAVDRPVDCGGIASCAPVAGCTPPGSYQRQVDAPLACGPASSACQGGRQSFASYLRMVDAPLDCAPGGACLGGGRSPASYLHMVDAPLDCGPASGGCLGGGRGVGYYQCLVDQPLGCGLTGGACGCATPACAPTLPERPPTARPGETWCKVLIPAQYATVTEEIETVCPSVQREWVPPLMGTRVIPVVLHPPGTDVIRTPGATRVDRVCTEICPARTETHAVVRTDGCGCTSTTCETVHVPAVNGMCAREVCVQAPGTKVLSVPEQISAETCQVELRPGYWRQTAVPGVKERRTRVVCKTPERWEWQRNPSCTPPAVPVVPPCLPAQVPVR